ncbi:myomegalin-like [Phoenicopterus ruber ruber]
MAASQDGPWGEGDEDPALAEPGGSHGPPGAQPQPGPEQDPLVQTCLLRDLEMGPLAQTQTLRDFEQHLNDLKKENFSLKLRIYFLEERVQQKGEGSRDDVYRRNIELKVEVESLKRELQEKQQALDNTWVAAENQTTRSQAALRQQYEERQRESEHVYELLENKIQLLQECLSIPCPSLPLRRIEELTQELAATNRLVETLSAEKRDLQQRLEEPPAVGGQHCLLGLGIGTGIGTGTWWGDLALG